MRGSSSMLTKLQLLAWKYFCYRKFHWILTLTEVIAPIVLIYVGTKLGEKLFHGQTIHYSASEPNASTTYELITNVTYSAIHYVPVNLKTKRVIDCVLKMINHYRSHLVKPIVDQPAHSEDVLVSALIRDTRHAIGVVFLSTESLFEYKIRDKRVWDTRRMFTENEIRTNDYPNSDPYFYTGFAGLQFCVDRCYILGEINDHDVTVDSDIGFGNTQASFQGLPYPAYSDTGGSFLPLLFAYAIIVSSWILICPLMRAIIEEKRIGVARTMKVAGLSDNLLWIMWYVCTLLFGMVVYSIINYVFGFYVSRVETSLLWTFIILYFSSQLAFAFTFCALFRSYGIAIGSFCMVNVFAIFFSIEVYDWQHDLLIRSCSLCPVGAFVHAFKRLTYFQMLGIPLEWSYISSENESTDSGAPLSFIIDMFIIDTILYLCLAYYLNRINPEEYGIRDSFSFFPMSKERMGIAEFVALKKASRVVGQRSSDQLVEKRSRQINPMLLLKDLHKQYGPIGAVRGIELSVYENEIFVLLGKAETGKTTTLSMIPGLIEPTWGTILYKGHIDLLRNVELFGKRIGFCPQQNRLLPYFSIMDHLMFYGMLKGSSQPETKNDSIRYLKFLGLDANAKNSASSIPDTTKRMVSLMIALIGRTEILILDEPTAGLDVASKDKVYNLLKLLKTKRTIFLTSTSMKEARTIGDRIAVINNGKIVCNGSTPFLENALAADYELKLYGKTVGRGKGVMPVSVLIEVVKEAVPKSRVLSQSSGEVMFQLPSKETSSFSSLLKFLETKKTLFNIDRISVSRLTLEKIFQKIGGVSYDPSTGKPARLLSVVQEAPNLGAYKKGKLNAFDSVLGQHEALFRKNYILAYRNGPSFMYRVIFPTTLIAVLIWVTNTFAGFEPSIPLTMSLYPNSMVLALRHKDDPQDPIFHNQFLLFLHEQRVLAREIITNTSINAALLEFATKDIYRYRRRLLMAAQVTFMPHWLFDTKAYQYNIHYNIFARHSLPISLNFLNTVLYKIYMKKEDARVITYNHPIGTLNKTKTQDKFDTNITEQSPALTMLYVLLAFSTIDLLDYVATAAKVERALGFTRVQFVSNMSPFTYWSNTLAFDSMLFAGITVLRVILFKAFDDYEFLTFQYDFAIALLLIVLFIPSGLLFMYTLSFISSSRLRAYPTFFILNILCTFFTFTFYKLQTRAFISPPSEYGKLGLTCAKYLILLLPPFNFSLAFEKFIMSLRINYLDKISQKMAANEEIFIQERNKTAYLEYASVTNPNGLLDEVLFLLVDIVVYSALLYSIESGWRRWPFIGHDKCGQSVSTEIQAECDKAQNLIAAMSSKAKPRPNGGRPNNVLIVRGLKKVYGSFLTRRKVAVQNATFVVQEGECFGIVGLRGSGKTTTLRALTRDLIPSKGDVWIGNLKLRTDTGRYLSKAGYCPQSDCIMDKMSGKELLLLMSALRGVPINARRNLIDECVAILGLKKVIRKLCSTYDKDSKRRICTAMALIADPQVVMLDEPFNNMDPVAIKSLFAIVERAKSSGRCVVITSESLRDCDSLFDRFMILVEGKMKFIGNQDELRRIYGRAVSLLLLLNKPRREESELTRIDMIAKLKTGVQQKFGNNSCVILHETAMSVQYEIKEIISWAEAFRGLEELKTKFRILKEYQLSEKSLEEIFLTLLNEKKN